MPRFVAHCYWLCIWLVIYHFNEYYVFEWLNVWSRRQDMTGKAGFSKKGMLIYLNQYWRVVRVKWPKCSWSFACLLDFLRFMADTEMLLICFVFLSFLFPTWYDTYIFWHTFSSIVIIYFYLWSFYFWVFFMFVIFSEFF